MTLCAPALTRSTVPKLSPLQCFTESPNHTNHSLHSDETRSQSNSPESEHPQREHVNQINMSDRLNKLKPDRLSPSPLKRPSTTTPDSQRGQEIKQRRIDEICSSILQPTRSPKQASDSGHSSDTNTSKTPNRRKTSKPVQQHGSTLSPNSTGSVDDFVTVDIEADSAEQSGKINSSDDNVILDSDLDTIIEKKLQSLIQIQKEYTFLSTNRLAEALSQQFTVVGLKLGEVQENIKMLKDELNQVKAAINETLGDKFPKRAVTPAPRKPSPVRATPNPAQAPPVPITSAEKLTQMNSTSLAVADHFTKSQLTHEFASKMMNLLPPTSMSGRLPPLPGLAHPYMNPGLLPPQFNPTQQMAAAGLALQHQLFEKDLFLMQDRERQAQETKKPSKRQKITDTRISPRGAQISQTKREMVDTDGMSDMPPMSTSSRPIPAPGHLYPHLPGGLPGLPLPAGFLPFMNPNDNNNNNNELRRSPASGRYSERTGSDRGSISPSDMSAISSSHLPHIPGLMENLTPVHLRKAKLMFFYRRSPKPLYIKSFFPDVHFTKQNTEQIVKWFSNFREFYYQQIDKYARHFLKDGLQPEDVMITRNSEVVKNLNVHYNRNNQIEIPEKFLHVVVISIQEFMKAIKKGDDKPTNPNGTSSGWRKPIYKIVERYEDDVPELWKTQEWLEALGNDVQQM